MSDERPQISPTAGAVRGQRSAFGVLGAARAWRNGRWLGALSVALVFLGWYLINALALVPEILLPGAARGLRGLHRRHQERLSRDHLVAERRGDAVAMRRGLRAGLPRPAFPLGLAMGYSTQNPSRLQLHRAVHAAAAAAFLSYPFDPLARHRQRLEDRAALPHRLPDRGIERDGGRSSDQAPAHPGGALARAPASGRYFAMWFSPRRCRSFLRARASRSRPPSRRSSRRS